MARILDCNWIQHYQATVINIIDGRATIHVNELERNVVVSIGELRRLGKGHVGDTIAYLIIIKGKNKYRFLGIYEDDSNMSQRGNELS